MYLLQRDPCLPLHTCGTVGHLPKALKRFSHQWKQGEILTWSLLLSQGTVLTSGPPTSSSGPCCLSYTLSPAWSETRTSCDDPAVLTVLRAPWSGRAGPSVICHFPILPLPAALLLSACALGSSCLCLPTHPLASGPSPILFQQMRTLVPAHDWMTPFLPSDLHSDVTESECPLPATLYGIILHHLLFTLTSLICLCHAYCHLIDVCVFAVWLWSQLVYKLLESWHHACSVHWCLPNPGSCA